MNIIGQDDLIKEVENIFEITLASDFEIRPHFILTGESGSGKTLTIKTLAEKHKMFFLEINAAQLTKEGTSGNSLSKALSPLQRAAGKACLVFVDEFDKLFISGNSNDSHAHESTTGVQNEFLKVLESRTASVYGDYGKYLNIDVTKVLFVFAGAFNNEKKISLDRLREIGVKTEFLGRVGLVYNTEALSLEALYTILEESPLLKKYLQLFPDADAEKTIYVLKAHVQKHYDMNTLGARYINTLINQYFIKKGNLDDEEVESMSFKTKLSFD